MYSIRLDSKASKQLRKLPIDIQNKISEAINALAYNPIPHGAIKLVGTSRYRIRQGDYRIIYQIFKKEVLIEVVAVGHRKNVYQ